MMKNKKIKKILLLAGGTIIVAIVGLLIIFWDEIPEGIPLGGMSPAILDSSVAYVTQTTNESVAAYPIFLDRILVGKNVTSARIQMADTNTTDATDGVFFRLIGDSLLGAYEVGASLSNGLAITASGEASITIIYRAK